jgi:preprotein translocase subunit SecA
VLGGNPEPEINRVLADESLDPAAREQRVATLRAEWQLRHDQVLKSGGLHIIGTERHESRRIDNQLRGRSGRQGDPGSSRFYLALDDSLLRIFASDRVSAIMERLKMPDGEAIEHPWVTRSIENAQRKVEARNFDMRKHLLEYDDVANDQRKVIYQQRNELLESSDISATIAAMRADVVNGHLATHVPPGSLEEQWDIPGLETVLRGELGLDLPVQQWLQNSPDMEETVLRERVVEAAHARYIEKTGSVDQPAMRQYERAIMLQSVDSHWREHLSALDHLRQGIHLRGYAQKNPTQEYKREAFELFSLLLDMIKTDVTRTLMTVQIRSAEELRAAEDHEALQNVQYQHADALTGTTEPAVVEPEAAAQEESDLVQPYVRDGQKVGRNDPCPCGSGKKYKQCHGKLS